MILDERLCRGWPRRPVSPTSGSFDRIDSTNRYLLDEARIGGAPKAPSPWPTYQTAGPGPAGPGVGRPRRTTSLLVIGPAPAGRPARGRPPPPGDGGCGLAADGVRGGGRLLSRAQMAERPGGGGPQAGRDPGRGRRDAIAVGPRHGPQRGAAAPPGAVSADAAGRAGVGPGRDAGGRPPGLAVAAPTGRPDGCAVTGRLRPRRPPSAGRARRVGRRTWSAGPRGSTTVVTCSPHRRRAAGGDRRRRDPPAACLVRWTRPAFRRVGHCWSARTGGGHGMAGGGPWVGPLAGPGTAA